MPLTQRFGRCFAAVALAAALFVPSLAFAVPSWGPDYDISEGEVHDTFTSSNNQRFLAVDDSNNLYVAFFDDRYRTSGDDNFEIFFRRFTFRFGSPGITRVTNSSRMSKYPSMAVRNWGDLDVETQADSGRVYIVWQDARLFSIPSAGEPISYTIYMRTYRSQGGSGFGPEIQVSPYDSLNAATLPVVAVGDSSRVWIVWQKPDVGLGTTQLYYSIYDRQTKTVNAAAALTDPSTFTGNASVAAGPDGVVHVVWADLRAGTQQIWTKRFVPGSGWTPDEQLVFSTGTSSAPSLTADFHSHMHLTWVDSRDDLKGEIYYKDYVPGVGWNAVDTRVTVNSSQQIQPYVDADAGGNVLLVWTDLRNGASNPDIFYDVRQSGVWKGNTPLVYAATDTTNSVQRYPGIAHDQFGTAYAAWTDERLPASGGRNKDTWYKVGTDILVTAVLATEAPANSRLLRNYPNPFNPSTRIQFTLSRDAQVSLRVFDVQGRLVRTLVDSYLAAGPRTVDWDGKSDSGVALASGAYFLRLQGGGTYLSRKVNLVK